MIAYRIRLFGAFKKYGIDQNLVTLSVDHPLRVSEVKLEIASWLKKTVPEFGIPDESLIHDSALATDTDILLSDDIIEQNVQLNLLPPVCGG